MFSILRYHVNELRIMLVLINVITLGTLWCMVKIDLRRRYRFRLTPYIAEWWSSWWTLHGGDNGGLVTQ